MEIKDSRKLDADGEAREVELQQFDDFKPTVSGFMPVNDSVLLRELVLPDDSMIATPDAYAEPCLYCEVIDACETHKDWLGNVVRILKGIGTTIQFKDVPKGERYFTVNYQDVIGRWIPSRPVGKVMA